MHLPIRYIDETIVTPIRDIQMGALVQLEAEVIRAEIVYKPKKNAYRTGQRYIWQLAAKIFTFLSKPNEDV